MGKRKRDFADTYVFDDDVLDEMEGFEATSVFDNSLYDNGATSDDSGVIPDDDELLDDINASTVVFDKND